MRAENYGGASGAIRRWFRLRVRSVLQLKALCSSPRELLVLVRHQNTVKGHGNNFSRMSDIPPLHNSRTLLDDYEYCCSLLHKTKHKIRITATCSCCCCGVFLLLSNFTQRTTAAAATAAAAAAAVTADILTRSLPTPYPSAPHEDDVIRKLQRRR